MTKTFAPFALAFAAAVSATPVLAADLTNYSEPAPAYNEPSSGPANWTGAYVGGHGGMTSRKINPFDGGKGLNLGVHGGYNADVGGAVVGGELDYSYLGDAGVKARGGKLDERHRIAAKVKAGVPLDQTLVYGTTGLAMTKFRDHGDVSGPDGWKPGFLIGAGVEQNLTSNISARVEYNYVMTGDVRSETGGVESKKDVHDHTINLGVNYKF
ncbi:outer membrane protein [Neorhizobium alkalisoli]|uniref:Outer membrane immunogenic protein n=1 Tax=Neorhizobium alkalisoli TaxID=528178 RepID=A0A561R1K1_9HYPH|nr:outer membrane protein [Neorhizobium alkalisoli]TWF56498.1 outer membrane immunogenic protein [Neorhizobium alkalisoli]